jgi:stearoyl-CoA desaturase (Delta-9 desaturase)
MQGSIIRWVADHRRHHRFTDSPGDLHSPYFDTCGHVIADKTRGLWHAHIGWMFTGKLTNENRYAADLLGDSICVWFSNYYWLINGLVLLSCGMFSYALTEETSQAFPGVGYAGCMRVTLIHQFTWAVNSIGHTYGTRVAGSKDFSTNNIMLAVFTIGDGLHSSHHLNPARCINHPIHFDLAGIYLRVLNRLGIIWQLRR